MSTEPALDNAEAQPLQQLCPSHLQKLSKQARRRPRSDLGLWPSAPVYVEEEHVLALAAQRRVVDVRRLKVEQTLSELAWDLVQNTQDVRDPFRLSGSADWDTCIAQRDAVTTYWPIRLDDHDWLVVG